MLFILLLLLSILMIQIQVDQLCYETAKSHSLSEDKTKNQRIHSYYIFNIYFPEHIPENTHFQ